MTLVIVRPDLRRPPPVSLRDAQRSPLFIRVRGFATAGLLARSGVRRQRRSVCSACPESEPATHMMTTCKKRKCGCVGGTDIENALAKTTCPLNLWPA